MFAPMPDLDLKPGKDYRWRRPLHPLIGWGGIAASGAVLSWAWWFRDQMTPNTLFGVAVIAAMSIGLILSELLRNID